MKHAENESSIGQSRSAKYRQLKRMGEDVQTSDYMKKKMRQSEDDQIVDLDIEKIMIENPLMSNKEIVGNLQVIRKRLGKAAFHTNVRNDKSSQGHADAQHKCVVYYNSVALGDI